MKKRTRYDLWNYWLPQPGAQTLAYTCPADEVFYGGERGGGKTDVLIGRQIAGALKYRGYWNGLIIRRKYKDFKEMRRRWDELIANGLPAKRSGGEEQINFIRFDFGAVVSMVSVDQLKDVEDFQGHQYCEIGLEEAPEFPFLAGMVDMLKACLRSPQGVPCHMFLTGNPGGAGVSAVKAMYIPIVEGGESPVDAGQVWRIEHTDPDTGQKSVTTRVFIRSKLEDNRILTEADPNYRKNLLAIQDPNLRAAWAFGKWDVFIGQAFNFNRRHIIKPVPVPDYAPLYMTFDWGFGAPFSIGWWWVDGDNRVYRFAEWYGWQKGRPNEGLRLTDQQIALGIIEREVRLGIAGRKIIRLAGPDCFQNKPNYMGGGQGPSTADIFTETGMGYKDYAGNPAPYNLTLYPGDATRRVKIRQFRNRLQIPDNPDELPMLVVYDTCTQFIRTVPSLVLDELTKEDLEDHQEDHCFGADTEILTDQGWKLFSALDKTEKVATLSKDGTCEWQQPYDYIERDYDGLMKTYDGRVNFQVTPEHRFPAITKSRYNRHIHDWKLKQVKDLNDSWFIPRTAKPVDNRHLPWIILPKEKNHNANNVDGIPPLAFFKYYGFWLAEGCLAHGAPTHYSVHVDQTVGGEDIVAALGYKYIKDTRNSGCTRYTINSKQFYDYIVSLNGNAKASEKSIPRWMLNAPYDYLMALYDGMMQGDGSCSNGMFVYNTTSKQLADDFQELLFRLGKVGNIKKYEQKHTHILGRLIHHKLPYYRIHILAHPHAMVVKGKTKEEQYKDKIYCVRVPNETVYVRRAGTPYWSGNCYDDACHICMARPYGVTDEDRIEQAKVYAAEAKMNKLDPASRSASEEYSEIIRLIKAKEEGQDTGDLADLTDFDLFNEFM